MKTYNSHNVQHQEGMENDQMAIENKMKKLNAKKEGKHMYKFRVPHVWTHLYVHKKLCKESIHVSS
jgi:hypothetical protein